ncbi:MAG: hypothetical protein HKO71_04640, partial [Pseudomonadales bacterium]|nr:hypothetical protein [Pseudomonadales bacterium]
ARTDAPGCAPLKQSVHTELSVQDKCVLEWFPMETIVFNGASIDLHTHVQLQEGALFCGWEIVCLGLPACQSCFDSGDILQSFALYREQRPVLIDRLQLDAGCNLLRARCGMAALPVSGLFVVGPLGATGLDQADVEALLDTLRTTIAQRGWQETLAVTRVNDLLLMRYLGAYADEARDAFTVLWQLLRPAMLQRAAVLPRIWAT